MRFNFMPIEVPTAAKYFDSLMILNIQAKSDITGLPAL
jgi:hypothetical protein